MSFETIVALDLGKFKTVLCVMDVATRTHRFATIDSTPTAIGVAVKQHVSIDPTQTLVVFETCDTCGWVHDEVAPLGVKTVIVNANDERWRWQRVKGTKTDQDDALQTGTTGIVRSVADGASTRSTQQRQRRRLMIHRRSIVSRRTPSVSNAIRSIFSQQGYRIGQRTKSSGRSQASGQLQSYAQPIGGLLHGDELWRGRLNSELQLMASINTQLKGSLDNKLDELADPRMKLLQTLKGVGPSHRRSGGALHR